MYVAHRAILAALLMVVGVDEAAIAQDAHTPHDTIPDFCASPSIRSVASGRWSSPGTWSPARLPTSSDIVQISQGTSVIFDQSLAYAVRCVGVDGNLEFDTSLSTRLWAGNIMVNETGQMYVGREQAPVPANVTAEIVIANQPLDTANDPGQYGTALIALGKLVMHGAVKDPTFARAAVEPLSGQNTITLDRPATGWRIGDRLVIPDTRHMRWNDVTNWAPTTPQWEERNVQAVSADGRTITLSSPLTYNHRGARDVAGALTFLPHVGNLTRNVVIRSESAIGQPGTKGHTMLTYRADADLRYVQFKDLGRTTIEPLDNGTNHIGRYALHAHHLIGPVTTPANGYQFTFVGNSFDGGSTNHNLKWAVAIHDAHYGLLKDNVAYNYAGALFTFEDGSESFNVVDHNFAVRSKGKGDRLSEGTEGGGFWFKGPNNYVRNNVAANLWGDQTEAAYGFKYFMLYLGNIKVPTHKGADTSVAGEYVVRNGNNMPLLEFNNNEIYGAAQGLTYWWLNKVESVTQPNPVETRVQGLKIWHVYNKAIYSYHATFVTFDGLIIRGDKPDDSVACCGKGWHGEDYPVGRITIRNSNIQGMRTGIKMSTYGTDVNTIEDSFFSNNVNVEFSTLRSTNGGAGIPPRVTIMRSLRFQPWPGADNKNILMTWDACCSSSQYNTTQRDEVYVYRYQDDVNDNFRAYYSIQGTQDVAGGRAPCGTTRSGIEGIVCTISGGSTLPSAPRNLRLVPPSQ